MTTLVGRYRLLDLLGEGGMGVVWRAHDRTLGRDVAIKLLRPIVASDAQQRRRFEREARTLAVLANENIVRVHDFVDDEAQAFLVMEFVDGRNLADTTVARLPLELGEAAWYAASVAHALAYAHAKGVVHRDLTPANILVERGTGRVVTTDFGLARVARTGGSLTTVGMLVGTPEYWSPEQARGSETGPATDLYALGCILYLLLGGRPPFEGDDRLAVGLRRAHEPAPSLTTVAPELPAAAAELVDSLLSSEPGGRPDAATTAASLSNMAAGTAMADAPGRARARRPVRCDLRLSDGSPRGRLADGLRRRPGGGFHAFAATGVVVAIPRCVGTAPVGEPPPASARARRRGCCRADRRSRCHAFARGTGAEGARSRLASSLGGACSDPPVAARCERVRPLGVLDAGVTRPGDQSASGSTDQCRRGRGREADGEQGNTVRGGSGRPRRRIGAGSSANAGARRFPRTAPLHAVLDREEGRSDRAASRRGRATSASGDREGRSRLRLPPRGRAAGPECGPRLGSVHAGRQASALPDCLQAACRTGR